MLESQLAFLLQRYLGDYVTGIDRASLEVSVLRGDVSLANLSLKPGALDGLALPLTVRAGLLGRLSLRIPWANLRGSPVVVEIDRVYILAGPADADAACAVLVAAVDMAPGDEVTLCYVDEGASLAERAAALRDYGIAACDCARCEAERTAAGGAPAPPRRPARSSRGRSSSADDGGGAPAAKRRRRESAWLGAWRAAG
jgi:hypothetical protein